MTIACAPVEIITSGNDRLTILFSLPEHKVGGTAPIVYNVFLKEPACAAYQGELIAEALL